MMARNLLSTFVLSALFASGVGAYSAAESASTSNTGPVTLEVAHAAPVAAKKTTVSNARAAKALSRAKTRKGKKNYRYGGTGPTKFDCSGLTQWAYRQAGVKLPRTSGQQRASRNTVHVSRYKARPGDLVFWGKGHVELLAKKPYRKGGYWYTVSFGAGSRTTGIRYRTTKHKSKVPHIERVRYTR